MLPTATNSSTPPPPPWHESQATAPSLESTPQHHPLPGLLDAVRHAFVSGMSTTLWVSAALMAAGAVVALVFRPRADEPGVAQLEESPDQIAA